MHEFKLERYYFRLNKINPELSDLQTLNALDGSHFIDELRSIVETEFSQHIHRINHMQNKMCELRITVHFHHLCL